jgi:hypothetical protein
VAFLVLKNNVFSKKKNSSPPKKNLPFSYATFQCGRYILFKFFFSAHKKLKKPPSKVAHNQPKPFIPQPNPPATAQNPFFIS